AQERPRFFEQVAEWSAKVEPAEARPGQTVTWSVTVTPLLPGWHTYPTKQAEGSEAESTVNEFQFDKAEGPGKFAGQLQEPPYRPPHPRRRPGPNCPAPTCPASC